MTGNDIITASLRLIGVLQETETPSAEQSATSLLALNDMMADLSGDGADLGYAPQSDPTVDIGLNIEAAQAVKYLLALLLCSIYTRTPPQIVVAGAIAGRNKILRDAIYRTRNESTMTHVPLGSGRRWWWNITTGW